jgi:hypothetical protein
MIRDSFTSLYFRSLICILATGFWIGYTSLLSCVSGVSVEWSLVLVWVESLAYA